MINLDEIRSVAARVALANTVVEKDYALGWLLWGIHQHPETNEDWIFKGGTCLKKCYFETYRFSEDLDFTYRGKVQPSVESLTKIFAEISNLIADAAGLEFPKASIQFEIFKNPRDSLSIQGGVKYRGPVRPQVGLAHMQRIKIDLTLDEPLVLAPVTKQVDHPYSDLPDGGINILSYDYEEVFSEKVRALAQRLRPRDLYDVIHLHRRLDLNPNRERIVSTLKRKCSLRGIAVPTMDDIETHQNLGFLQSEWENQLKHQILVLPDFNSFLFELPQFFAWLEGKKTEFLEQVPSSEFQQHDLIRRESIGSLVPAGPATSYMDKIRFAAANRLILSLGYGGGMRDIEPYALARSSDGNLLLRALRHDSGEWRSYSFDLMQNVQVTDKTFVPKYAIEISSAGYLPVRQLTKNSAITGKERQRMSRSSGPIHIYRCGICGKEFKRKTQDSSLNPHKNKSSSNCSGRHGAYVRTVLE